MLNRSFKHRKDTPYLLKLEIQTHLKYYRNFLQYLRETPVEKDEQKPNNAIDTAVTIPVSPTHDFLIIEYTLQISANHICANFDSYILYLTQGGK